MDINSLPDTDSPEVMEQAVSLWLTSVIWGQKWREVHPDAVERTLLELYDNVFRTVHKTHHGG